MAQSALQLAQQIHALRQNTIDQTAYTPQAQAALQRMPISLLPKNANAGGMYSPVGFSAQDYTPSIKLSQDFWSDGGVGTLRHEFIHSQDSNVNGLGAMNYAPKSGFLLNSFNFYNNVPPGVRQRYIDPNISDPIYDQTQMQVKNIEGAAYVGQNPGVMQQPWGQTYNQVYIPMSKAINYSPANPSPEYIRNQADIEYARRQQLKKSGPPAKVIPPKKAPSTK